MNTKSFTLIELIVIILVIGILTAFVISSLSPARDSANDAKRKTDISNLFTSILARGTSESFYPSITSNIKDGETNSELQTYISTFLKTIPNDPLTTNPYFFISDSKDFVVGAVLSDGIVIIKFLTPQ